jgi:hypothetical protein
MAQEVTSLAALMKSNARLRKHMDKAKQATPIQDFNGPAGEYICKFKGSKIITKDSNVYHILEFCIDGSINGQEAYANHTVGVFDNLSDVKDKQTAEQGLERLMVNIQKLGVPTKDLEVPDIDGKLVKLKGSQFTIRVTKSRDKTRNYFDIVGMAADVDDQDYSSPEDTEGDSADVDDTTDEWSEELEEAAAEEADDTADAAEAEFAPSDWIGFDVDYKPAKSPKALTFKVIAADDDAGTVTLERDGKKVKANYADLILP